MDYNAVYVWAFLAIYGFFLFRLFQLINPFRNLSDFFPGLAGLLVLAAIHFLLIKHPSSRLEDIWSFLPIVWSVYSVALLFDGYILKIKSKERRPLIYAGVSVFSITLCMWVVAYTGLHWILWGTVLSTAAAAGALATYHFFLHKSFTDKIQAVVLVVMFIVLLIMLL
jgi:hypothetical protein